MSEPVHKTLAGALLAFQADCPTLPKDAVNPHFKSKFTSLDTIVETVKPLLQKHGLVWTTLPVADDEGRPMLEYRLVHAGHEKLLDDGTGKTFAMEPEAITGRMPLLLQKQDPQGLGSALTYARRYALSAVLNLVADEDEDGNAASPRQPARQQQQQQRNGSEYATKADQDALAAAAKGLTVRQIKLALGSVGSSFPEKGDVFSMVPKGTAKRLTELLAATPREQPVPASPGELS